MRPTELPFYARLSLVLISLTLIYFIITAASGIFIPLTFSLIFAILLYPAVKFMEEKMHINKNLAPVIAILIATLFIGFFIYIFIEQIIHFSDDLPMLRNRFVEMFADFQRWLSTKMHITKKEQFTYMDNAGSSVAESVAYSIKGIFYSITTIILWTIFIILFTFFMLYHRNLLKKFLLHLFSEGNRDKVSEIIVETKGLINSYVLALLIEMFLVGIANCSYLFIVGNKYAILLGLMAAVLNIIPYIGIYTSIFITMLVTFANSTGGASIEAGIGLFVVHLIDANILLPKLVGGRVKMNPFITILAVMVGEFVWGVPGMFLFIPITGIIKLVCERVDGLEAWGILIGTEEKIKRVKKNPPLQREKE